MKNFIEIERTARRGRAGWPVWLRMVDTGATIAIAVFGFWAVVLALGVLCRLTSVVWELGFNGVGRWMGL